MSERRITEKVWLSYGRVCGFAIGINVSRWSAGIDLGFWYIGLEY